MELLIVLGLCFGAYELLGVFQGCFHYNEHALPYQPQQYKDGKEKSDGKESELENDNEKCSDNFECEKRRLDRSELRRKILERRRWAAATIHQQLQQHQHQQQEQQEYEYEEEEEEQEEEEEDEIEEEEETEIQKSGPCSCYSTVTEDDFDDDTRTILRNNSCRSKRQQRNPINKFSLSKSLMSLNRDESNFLFNYLDDAVNKSNSRSSVAKFTKFRSELEISETSFNRTSHNSSDRSNSNNDNGHKWRGACRDSFDTIEKHNEANECNASVTLDTNNKKKIFFISAAS
jgi:hypothetical protein